MIRPVPDGGWRGIEPPRERQWFELPDITGLRTRQQIRTAREGAAACRAAIAAARRRTQAERQARAEGRIVDLHAARRQPAKPAPERTQETA